MILRRSQSALDDTISYVSPKHLRPLVDEFTIVIEPHDRRVLKVRDAIADPLIWSKLMWGQARDLQLIRKLQNYPSLAKLEEANGIKYQQGITYGDRKKPAPQLDGMKIFDAKMFPPGDIFSLETDNLPAVNGIRIHSRASTGLEAFSWPQIIIKHSWNRPTGRFHARLNLSEDKGILCSQSYLSVHATMSILEAACISHNSSVAVYFHFLTSGRFAAYRPKLSKDEILNLPIPMPASGLLDDVSNYLALDARAFELFALKDAERVLIEDSLKYTLDDFLGGDQSVGKQPTSYGDGTRSEQHLRAYCEYFIRVLKAGFGNEKSVSATVFRSPIKDMPYRLVAFKLGGGAENAIEVRDVRSSILLEEFERLNDKAKNMNGGIFNQRVARIYDVNDGVPTVFVIKPDQKRFWTRSMGLQDSDEVALDLFRWQRQPMAEDEGALH